MLAQNNGKISRIQFILIHLVMILLLVVTVLNSVKPHIFWGHFEIENIAIHSVIEALGALAAILMGFMSIQLLTGTKDPRYELISFGLLAMGCWDLFHSFLPAGRGFVFTHTLALLLGGFLFCLILFNWHSFISKHRVIIKVGLLILLFSLGGILIIYQENIPLMVYNNKFTLTAKILNLIAGMLFLESTLKLYFDFLKHKRMGLLLLTMLALLSAIAGIVFPFSHAWTDSWWFWHGLRLTAFIFMLGYMLMQFSKLFIERTSTLQAMRASEEKFRTFIELVPIPLCNINQTTGEIAYVNDAFKALFGYTQKDIPNVEQWWRKAYPKEVYRRKVMQRWNEAVTYSVINKTNISSEAYEITCHDGNVSIVIIGGVVIGNDLLATFLDITAMRGFQKALSDEKSTFKSTIDNLPGIYYRINQYGYFEVWNKRFNDVTGYNDKEMSGFRAKDLFEGDDKEKISTAMQRVFENGNTEVEAELVTIENEKIPYLFSGSLFETGGKPYLIGMGMDISKLKYIENSLRQTNINLSKTNKELEVFAYVASHDLQEPLRKIYSFTDLLETRYSELFDERAQKYMKYITGGAKRMQQLISDLLQFSRIGSNLNTYEKVDIGKLIRPILGNLYLFNEGNDADIQIGDLPVIFADKVQMMQLFQNLISNALKFRGDSPAEIRINCKKQADNWLFSIRDNGIGIAEEYAEKIFVVFQRLHGQDEYPGTGIGLAICKKIVERHLGDIWFDSKPGIGSTFYFTINGSLGKDINKKSLQQDG